ncbi:MAG: ATP-binding protein [Candidatus Curtissbacteria bacterium]|nr:ATP-binding protein [Candidatus Curtissbacteria bacterium]
MTTPNIPYNMGSMDPDIIDNTDSPYIKRDLEDIIYQNLNKGKVIILYGPRRAGKTTLIRHLFKDKNIPYLYLNCRQKRIQKQIVPDSLELKTIIGDHKNIIFDEAQYLEDPGEVFTVLIDTFPNLNIIASGSSSFELSGKVQEPATGRNLPYYLFPLSYHEIEKNYPATDINFYLDQTLRFGSYPEIFHYTTTDEKIHYLQLLTNDYLYKDILDFERVNSSAKLQKLLEALSLQIGQQVSYSEIANMLSIDRKTVEYYIDLLEKTYVIFRLYPYSRNLRSEINQKVKIYFYDVGVRNALINNFNSLDIRSDCGFLFENYFIAEMIKQNINKLYKSNFYYWRTYTQKEIDLIEEREGKLSGFECKYSDKRSVPRATLNEFVEAYPGSIIKTVTPQVLKEILESN